MLCDHEQTIVPAPLANASAGHDERLYQRVWNEMLAPPGHFIRAQMPSLYAAPAASANGVRRERPISIYGEYPLMLRDTFFMCVVYARSALDEAVTEQFKLGQAYLRELGDPQIKLVAQYCDSQEIGDSLDHEGLNLLRADAKAGAFQAIVVSQVSRIIRRHDLLFSFVQEMADLGIAIIDIGERTCTDVAMHARFFPKVRN